MKNDTKRTLLKNIDELLTYLNGMRCGEHISFTPEEVSAIIQKEEAGAEANYEKTIARFLEDDQNGKTAKSKRFVVYMGYPGAGKSVMTQKLIDRFAADEDCLPFRIVDKDEYRDLFPNLFNHLKNGHISECDRFSGIATKTVRKVLDLSLQSGKRSILSVGVMGAGVEFADNAAKAMEYGYKPCAVYMSVNPDIAYLSNVYRCATLYDQIMFQNSEVYPRLFFNREVMTLPQVVERIDSFQKENAKDIDLMVVNRANELLYDTRRPHLNNVREVIAAEENRPLKKEEIMLINKQIHQIYQNMQYRYENGIYTPCRSEVDMAKTAVSNIRKLISRQSVEMELPTFMLSKRIGNGL